MFVDVKDKAKRLEFIEFLLENRFTIDSKDGKSKDWLIDSGLPLIINYKDKSIDRFDSAKKVASLIKNKELSSVEDFYGCYFPWLNIDENQVGYTKEELIDYFGDWDKDPIETMDLSQDKGEPNFDEDDYGFKASCWAISDFEEHQKKMELKDFPNKEEYSTYLETLRGLVWKVCPFDSTDY